MNVSVEEISDDGLTCHQTEFWLDKRYRKFVLNAFYIKKRKTKRHHFKAEKIWNRCDQRHNNTERPFVTSSTKQKVLDVFIASIKFEDGF